MEEFNNVPMNLFRAGSEQLAPIKVLLPQDISYDEIRLVVGQYVQKAKGENKKA